ncbi:hypothetical protein [Candidatus Electronema sp. PJ]|uniref:hypothetical protein n=1 Tax=Candidatus Electronema sp. PJ TaxID=3401572 RepID=UPI003AA9CB4E
MGRAKPHQQYSRRFFCTVLPLFGILLLYAYLFDPWQLFHQPWFRKPVFISNARFQNAGLINSYEFDSVILGNSMAENFSAKEASAILSGKFVNLSMAGSLFSERQIVLQHLFRKKKVRQVIISLDHLPYVHAGQYSKDMPPEKFVFLYNRNPLDDFRLYFDVQLLRCWNFMQNNSCWDEIPGSARVKSLEELYKWFPYYTKAFGGTKAWCAWTKQSPPFKIFLEEIIRVAASVQKGKKDIWSDALIAECHGNSSSSFDQHLLPFLQEHPDTQFLLFFPPYSRLWYAMQAQYYSGYYQTYQMFVQHVVKTAGKYPNAQIFGFDSQDFTADLANYKDQSHYHKDINAKILHLMAEKSSLLTEANLATYLRETEELAKRYDLQGVAEIFQKCLKP